MTNPSKMTKEQLEMAQKAKAEAEAADKAKAEAEAADKAKAEAEAADKAKAEAEAADKAKAEAEAADKEETQTQNKKFIFKAAVSLTSKKGLIRVGAEVKKEYFSDPKAFDALLASNKIIRD